MRRRLEMNPVPPGAESGFDDDAWEQDRADHGTCWTNAGRQTALKEDGQTDLCLDLTLGKIGLLNARMSYMKHVHLYYRIR